VVDKPAVACRLLIECCPMTITACEVLQVALPNKAGALAGVAARLAKKRVNIDYVYGTTAGKGRASVIVKPANLKLALKALR
jgi:hypothetical protein